MDLEEQLTACDMWAHWGYRDLLRFVSNHEQEEIVAAMRQGFIDGHADYGDRSWNKTHAELRAELLAECRDGGNYCVIARHQGQAL